MKDIYIIMNRQNILNYYGSKLDLKLDSSELYDYQLTTNEVDYDIDVLDLTTPIVYSALTIDQTLLDASCSRNTITLVEYNNSVNNSGYTFSGLTLTLNYDNFITRFGSPYRYTILNNDIYTFTGITGETHYFRIGGFNNTLNITGLTPSTESVILSGFTSSLIECSSKLANVNNCCPVPSILNNKPWVYKIDSGSGNNNCSPIVRRRTEKGWTLDFVFNRETLSWSSGNIFYYLGVLGNTDSTNYLDNNLSFRFTSDGKVKWVAHHYSGTCDPTIGYTQSHYIATGQTPSLCVTNNEKDFNLTIVFNRYKELTGCDLENEGGFNDLIQGPHAVEFVKPLTGVTAMTSTQIVEGYTITNTISDWVTGGTITTEYIEKLNKKWANERDSRLGELKFYLNGDLIYTQENWEEIIPSYRDNQEMVQSWGGGMDYSTFWTATQSVSCFNIKSIKYYEEPLDFVHVKHNFRTRLNDFDFEICNAPCVDDVYKYVPPTATPTSTPSLTPTPTPTTTPTLTPTPTPTGAPTSTPTPTVTGTPTPTPTPFITPTPYPFTTQLPSGFTFDADYIIVSYAFTDGNDLDTRTRISSPNIGQNSAQSYLGWCRSELFPDNGGTPILTWSGDNTGLGFESVFVNLIEFKNQYPSETSLTIEMSAMWYSDPLDPGSGPLVGVNPVIMDVMLYKGGTVSLVQSDFLFINEGYSGIYGVASEGKVVTTQSQECFSQELVARLQYNLVSHNGQFI